MPRMQFIEDLFHHPALNPYPTSEEIMATPVLFKAATIAAVNEWKATFYDAQWKTYDKQAKLHHLYTLLTRLSQLYNKPLCIVNGSEYHYSPLTFTIMLDANKPSIISTLHEFSHHINGTSEKRACRWSVWLFKTVFPKAFEKLTFTPNSHTLCKMKPSQTSKSNSLVQKDIS